MSFCKSLGAGLPIGCEGDDPLFFNQPMGKGINDRQPVPDVPDVPCFPAMLHAVCMVIMVMKAREHPFH